MTSTIAEVDLDTCILEADRAPGSNPGGALLPGDTLRCWTHAHSIAFGKATYFQAVETCVLVKWASPGQRPRRSTRLTAALSADDAVKLYLAMLRANLLGMPLTYFATVAWTTVGLIDDAEIQAATQALMTRIREWSTRKREPIHVSWIWCHERGPHLGLHTHLLMHVPHRDAPRLGKVICRFLENYSGRALAVGSEDGRRTFKAIEPSSRTGILSAASAIRFQRRLMRYMMKGVDPNGITPKLVERQAGQQLCRALGVGRPRDQGEIAGKRCGYSVHNVGRAAFARHPVGVRLGGDTAENLLRRDGFAFDAEALQLHHIAALLG